MLSMHFHIKRPIVRQGLVLVCVLAILIFDLLTPRYYAAWSLYMIPLFLTIWVSRRSVYVTAMLVTIAIIVGLFFSPSYMFPKAIPLFNRGTGIVLVWMMVYLILNRIAWKEALLDSKAALEARVKERTKDLEAVTNSLQNSLQGYITEIEKMNRIIFDSELKIAELEKKSLQQHE